MSLTLAIVLLFTEAFLVARGQVMGAIALAALALPVFIFAARRQRTP